MCVWNNRGSGGIDRATGGKRIEGDVVVKGGGVLRVEFIP